MGHLIVTVAKQPWPEGQPTASVMLGACISWAGGRNLVCKPELGEAMCP